MWLLIEEIGSSNGIVLAKCAAETSRRQCHFFPGRVKRAIDGVEEDDGCSSKWRIRTSTKDLCEPPWNGLMMMQLILLAVVVWESGREPVRCLDLARLIKSSKGYWSATVYIYWIHCWTLGWGGDVGSLSKNHPLKWRQFPYCVQYYF